MTQSRWITGGGGIRLHMVSAGPESAPPILFVHGYAQSHLSWRKQFAGPLAERFGLHALDSRGQGMSEKPPGHAPYGESRLWAEDMAAAVAACGRPPVVVGWSYGGLFIGDYVRHFGDADLAGLALVGTVMGQGQTRPPPDEASEAAMYSADIARAIPALRGMLERATEAPMDPADLADFTGVAAMAPAHVRLGINMRKESYLADYARVTKPVWIVFGDRDRLVSPSEGQDAKGVMPHAELTLYEGIGHMPFHESPARFDADLAAFAATCFSGEGR